MENEDQAVRVLLVDDERDFLASTAKALERRGFKVSAAASAGEARTMIATGPTVDVAVLDVRLPDGDGHDLFLEFKQKAPELQAIILTGNPDEDRAFLLTQRGLYDYLDKPCEIETLAGAINTAYWKERAPVGLGDEKPVEGLRVLLIDDEADYLRSLARTLGRRGLTVYQAGNGVEGLAVLAKEQVDVAVLDLKMPGMDGLEVLKKIKSDHPQVEVILLTGHATVDSGVEGMKMGAADYLFKPQDPDALLKKIQSAAGLRAKSEAKGGWWPFGKK